MNKDSGIPFFSYEELVVLAHKSVEARGEDYIYPLPRGGCYYVHENQASCLVGDMLWTANVIGPEFEEHGSNDEAVGMLFDSVFRTDEKGQDFMRLIQRLQDMEMPWGHAVELATGPRADALLDFLETTSSD